MIEIIFVKSPIADNTIVNNNMQSDLDIISREKGCWLYSLLYEKARRLEDQYTTSFSRFNKC